MGMDEKILGKRERWENAFHLELSFKIMYCVKCDYISLCPYTAVQVL